MIRPLILLVPLIAALVAAAPVLAQDASPHFFIERIEVRDASRVSPEVIIAESRLREGEDYSEADLRDAAARLSRLPFLLTADFSLEKGSERGRHVLVITVSETRSFFYRLDVVPLYSDPGVDIDTTTRLGSDDTSAALGYRWFLGRRGAMHIALIGRDRTEFTEGYSAFAIGWTQYDLFGTRAFATVNLKHSPGDGGVTPQIVVGVPLSLNQTVTAEYDQSLIEYGLVQTRSATYEDRRSQRLARVTWSFNTTNHPFVPTEGTIVTAGPLATWQDENYVAYYADNGSLGTIFIPTHSFLVGVQGSAQRYWEISDRNSVSLGAEGGVGRVEQRQQGTSVTTDQFYGVVQGGFSRSLWSPERRARGGDSRVELTLRGRSRTGIDEEHGFIRVFVPDNDVVQASVAWVRHSSWGTIRIGAGYAW